MTSGFAKWSDKQIQDALAAYGPVPNAFQCDLLRAYVDLLLRWNQRLSLTTVAEPTEILRFHVGESVAAIRPGKIDHGRLADVGSGAGFPGVPLAIFAPQFDVTLIESNAKKATFLAEVQRSLNLGNVDVFRGRFEGISAPARFEAVTARALGAYTDLLSWARRCLSPGGKVALWLGSDDAADISKTPGWSWGHPQALPLTKRRVILMGQLSD